MRHITIMMHNIINIYINSLNVFNTFLFLFIYFIVVLTPQKGNKFSTKQEEIQTEKKLYK